MAPFDFRGGGFVSAAELERWFEFCAWDANPDADPSLYSFEPKRGWFEVTVSRVAAVRPFILALADLLVADLLRFPPGTR
jgi:hypothetical protein